MTNQDLSLDPKCDINLSDIEAEVVEAYTRVKEARKRYLQAKSDSIEVSIDSELMLFDLRQSFSSRTSNTSTFTPEEKMGFAASKGLSKFANQLSEDRRKVLEMEMDTLSKTLKEWDRARHTASGGAQTLRDLRVLRIWNSYGKPSLNSI